MTNAKLRSQGYALAASGAYEKSSFTVGFKSISLYTNMISCSYSTQLKRYDSQNPQTL